jgi:DNA-binding ferritin-like protein
MKRTRARKQRGGKRHNKTHKLRQCTPITNRKSAIVENFIEMLNTIKLYHWNTHSFSQHKATDELYERLSGHVDKFVEVLLGKDGTRINKLKSASSLLIVKHADTFKEQIYHYREYLTQMNKCFDPAVDTDLLNIRDEILGDLNQFLYLMTLNR